jgi:hypothetical protein
MVQLIHEAAQGASAGLYPDTARQTERGDLPEKSILPLHHFNSKVV